MIDGDHKKKSTVNNSYFLPYNIARFRLSASNQKACDLVHLACLRGRSAHQCNFLECVEHFLRREFGSHHESALVAAALLSDNAKVSLFASFCFNGGKRAACKIK